MLAVAETTSHCLFSCLKTFVFIDNFIFIFYLNLFYHLFGYIVNIVYTFKNKAMYKIRTMLMYKIT